MENMKISLSSKKAKESPTWCLITVLTIDYEHVQIVSVELYILDFLRYSQSRNYIINIDHLFYFLWRVYLSLFATYYFVEFVLVDDE